MKARTFISILILSLLLVCAIPDDSSAAVSTNIPILNLNGGLHSGNDVMLWVASQGAPSTFTANFTASLPVGIKVLSADLLLYGNSRSYWMDDFYHPGDLTFMGQYFSSVPSWGYYINSWGGISYNYEWRSFNILNHFNNYVGGTQAFTAESSVTSSNPEWQSATVLCYKPETTAVSNRPYVQVVYAYVPSLPAIASPIAGSFNMDNVVLSATSTAADGGTITYTWEYTTSTWDLAQVITNTTLQNFSWAISQSIASGSTVYVRCKATAGSVSSGYSFVTFIKENEPAVAAKFAAERTMKALLKPTVFTTAISKATATKNASFTLCLEYTNDLEETLEDMEYTVRVNGGAWRGWAGLADSGFFLTEISVSPGLNLIEVRNSAGIESKLSRYSVWRL